MMGLTVNILATGNLELTADDETRHDLRNNLTDRGFWSAFSDLMESYSCNGSFTPFDAGEGNPFVGLTSAPCIAESMDCLDNGDRKILGRFWFFDNYMLRDPLEELAETGKTIFTIHLT